jgi:glycerol transport system ATP-binding protein
LATALAENTVRAKVQRVEDLGNHKLVTADFQGQSIKVKVKREQEPPAENVFLTIPAQHCCVYEIEHLI